MKHNEETPTAEWTETYLCQCCGRAQYTNVASPTWVDGIGNVCGYCMDRPDAMPDRIKLRIEAMADDEIKTPANEAMVNGKIKSSVKDESPSFKTMTHNGKITIKNPKTGNHRTFKIKTQPKDSSFAPGSRIVSMLIGPDNQGDYHQFGFVNDDGSVVVWRSKRGSYGRQSEWDKLGRMLSDLDRYSAKHGLQVMWSATCRKCNRELTTPESIQSGIGPVCAGKE
jgi:hypothetical protein